MASPVLPVTKEDQEMKSVTGRINNGNNQLQGLESTRQLQVTPGRLGSSMGQLRLGSKNHVPTPIPSVTDAASQMSNLEKREAFAKKLRKEKKQVALTKKRETRANAAKKEGQE